MPKNNNEQKERSRIRDEKKTYNEKYKELQDKKEALTKKLKEETDEKTKKEIMLGELYDVAMDLESIKYPDTWKQFKKKEKEIVLVPQPKSSASPQTDLDASLEHYLKSPASPQTDLDASLEHYLKSPAAGPKGAVIGAKPKSPAAGPDTRGKGIATTQTNLDSPPKHHLKSHSKGAVIGATSEVKPKQSEKGESLEPQTLGCFPRMVKRKGRDENKRTDRK